MYVAVLIHGNRFVAANFEYSFGSIVRCKVTDLPSILRFEIDE